MKAAVYPGSFDPVTFGHLDIIARAADVFDEVYVAVLHNKSKAPMFDVDERLEMLREATEGMPNVNCEQFSGLVIEYARDRGAKAIVRGLRAVSDFEFEFKMASMNRHLDPEIETVFMMTSSQYSFISSSIIKEVATFGGDVDDWIPQSVARRLRTRFGRRGKESGPS